MFPYSQLDLSDPRQTARVVIKDAISNIAFIVVLVTSFRTFMVGWGHCILDSCCNFRVVYPAILLR